jgi:hypothetical protein
MSAQTSRHLRGFAVPMNDAGVTPLMVARLQVMMPGDPGALVTARRRDSTPRQSVGIQRSAEQSAAAGTTPSTAK